MRRFFITAILLTNLSSVVPICAQVSHAREESQATYLGNISASDHNDSIHLEIQIDQLASPPHVFMLPNPDRIIFDFHGVLPNAGFKEQTVGIRSVRSVRTAIFGSDSQGRPITRVVVDLLKPAAYETKGEPGKFVIVVRDQVTPKTGVALSNPSRQPNVQPPSEKKTVAPSPASSTPGSGGVAQGNEFNGIEFSDSSATLTFKDPVTPRISYLHQPARLVLDFPEVEAGPTSQRSVSGPLTSRVSTVRTAKFQDQPAVYRVVFDESDPGLRPKVTANGARVVVDYGPQSPNSKVATIPKIPTYLSRVRSASPQPQARSSRLAPMKRALSTGSSTSQHGPKVSYTNGLLSIEATDSNLTDLLYAIAEKTGASIDMPFSDAMLDRITFTTGPGKPRDVLATVLEGSNFNYYIVENSSGGLEKIILTPK